nr:tRNA(Ile)(2)-agmatinylcytidine synthase [Methanohalophilus mahii]
MIRKNMIISFDDTDSRSLGMCTTYLGALLMDELKAYGKPVGLPLLIRLNPTIPFKTRGNAAVAIKIETSEREKVKKHVIQRIEELAQMEDENTNPGVVFLENNNEEVKNVLAAFFKRTVQHVITIRQAKEIIEKCELDARGYKNGRGLIGALAGCGAMLEEKWDHTYEYLSYRQKETWGTQRFVDENSVIRADDATYPNTWDNRDIANNLVVCIPHSPDPVLYGIRGKTPEYVSHAASMIEGEVTERYAIYKTNQGTDMHLIPAESISNLQDMESYIIQGFVASTPRTIEGGHTLFLFRDKEGEEMECAAFEPTKNFRELIRKLIPGDHITLHGSVKNKTLNIEKIDVIELAEKCRKVNPLCPECKKRMKSTGKGQGYRCRRCKTQADTAIRSKVEREIKTGMYEVPPCARRHLSMPLVRKRGKDTHPSR